ncbi:tyrosine-type recombinase/integrase [Gracilimonas sp. Q87]|uniref:tyrosine-type recombinase/integrase n=1 Tax=Gracilimonas sp. Q87 TaxID=3384766 RepID=UPI0039843317
MNNYYIYTPKKSNNGNNWVVRYKHKITEKRKQKSFPVDKYTKKEVQNLIKEIKAKDIVHNADDIAYDPFDSFDLNGGITILEAVELYLNTIEGKLALKTYLSRESVLMSFVNWIGTDRLMKTITEADVIKYIEEKTDNITSQNAYLAMFGYVYTYLEKKHDYKYTPTFEKFGTRNQRNAKKAYEIFQEDEFWKFYELGMKQEGSRKHKYWLHMQYMVIYFYTGMRTEELAHIKVKDIDFEGEWITIGKNHPTKTHEERTVWFPKKAHEYMKKVIKGKASDDYIVPREWKNEQGDYLRTVFYTFKRVLKTFKPDKKISLYDFRHSHGCWLMNNNFSVQFIMKQLGHSNYQTTMIYASMVNKQMKPEISEFYKRNN